MNSRPAAWVTASLLGLLLGACSKKAPPPEPIRAVRTVVVGAAVLTAVPEFAGEVRARTEARLGFRVGGKLATRSVEVGDAVRAGQVLAQLDPQDLQLGQEAARAALAAAQANLAQAQADVQRTRELREQGFVGAAELDRRENAWKAAKAQAEQATAQASSVGNQASYARLVSDVAGVVTAVEAEPGQVLAAGAPVVRVAQAGPRDVVFAVAEDRVQAFRALKGQAGGLVVRLWATGAERPATVREVAAAADTTTRTFLIKADLGPVEIALGQTATVRLPVAGGGQVLRLPLTALTESGGRSQVWVLDGAAMQVQMRPVQVASADGNFSVIASGLTAGEEVVTAGTHLLTPGLKVKRYVEPTASAKAAPVAPAPAVASAASR